MTTMLVVPDNGVSRTWISHAGAGPRASITTLPSSDGLDRSTLEPRSVSPATTRSDACSADMPTAKVALAGPRVSVGTESRANGNDGGMPSQIRPHSVSVWVGGWPAGGAVAAVDPPGTGVKLGPAGALAAGLVVGAGDADGEQAMTAQQPTATIGRRNARRGARTGVRTGRGSMSESYLQR